MNFEWDEAKNAANKLKHGIGFERAVAIFQGRVRTIVDTRFDYGETRQISFGALDDATILAVVHTDRNADAGLSPRGGPRPGKGLFMKAPYTRELTNAELAAMKDEDIDFSDIPELDEEFWKNAKVVETDGTTSVTLRVKTPSSTPSKPPARAIKPA